MKDRGREVVEGEWYFNGHGKTLPELQIAVLIDIATSLRAIRATLDCQNTIDIPRILRAIRANTTKPRKRKVAKRRTKR
jgi:hypothetical protein